MSYLLMREVHECHSLLLLQSDWLRNLNAIFHVPSLLLGSIGLFRFSYKTPDVNPKRAFRHGNVQFHNNCLAGLGNWTGDFLSIDITRCFCIVFKRGYKIIQHISNISLPVQIFRHTKYHSILSLT